jgi:epoxyqueuosine reductase
MEKLTHRIKEQAKKLGFQKIGIAKAEALTEEAQRLDEWLNRGYHGTMEWMVRNKQRRVDPRNILPEAKSLIVVAMNYYTDVQHSKNPEAGKVSRYAWGDDYHDVVTEQLKKLFEYICELEPAARGKVYVDTGPVMEKAWAQRAGIGWIGKHTNLITQEYGSWVFLGEIILNLELEYDVPAIDHCGSCTLCIEACPTDAIIEPYVLDANKCISYLTIEYREPFSAVQASQIENWVYGCDICQDVCPWNEKFSLPTTMTEFYPRSQNVAPKLEDIVSLTEAEFRERYRGSPMKRTKLSGLVRNAKAVLQHSAKSVEQ